MSQGVVGCILVVAEAVAQRQEVPGVKKGPLITAVLVVGLLVLGLLVGGCSLRGSSTTTTSSATSSTEFEGTVSSETTTTLGADSTGGSSTTVTAASTTTVTSPSTVVRYQQNDSHFSYSGKWTTSANSAASGGTFAYTNSSGGSVTITFEGTHLSLIAKTSSRYGKAKITMDGKVLGTIDLYSRDAKYQQKVWGTGTLKDGTHTVKIDWTGTKRAAASATNINVDCVLVTQPQ
jgi:hypothetical protein